MTHELERRIEALSARVVLVSVVYAVGYLLAFVLLTAACVALIDYFWRSEDPGLRYISSGLVVGVFAWLVSKTFRLIRGAQESPLQLAKRLERHFPQLKNSLPAAVDFLRHAPEDAASGSAELRQAVIDQATQASAGVAFTQVVSLRPMFQALAASLLAAAAVAGLVSQDPSGAKLASRRLLLPWQKTAWPQFHLLQIAEAPSRLQSGGTFEVAVQDARGASLPNDVMLHLRYAGDPPEEESQPMRLVDGKARFRREQIKRPFEFWATGGDDESMAHRTLEVIEPPQVRSFDIAIKPPAYTGLPAQNSQAAIRAWEGSTITAQVESTVPVVSGSLDLGASATSPLAVNTNGMQLHTTPQNALLLSAENSGTFWFRLKDAHGFEGGTDITYGLQVVKDAPPTVQVESPSSNLFVTPAAKLKVTAQLRDDLALAKLVLRFTRSDRSEQEAVEIPLWTGPAEPPVQTEPFPAGDKRTVDYEWDLAAIDQPWSGLAPGARLLVTLAAVDYKPQSTESTSRQITIITPQELEARLGERQSLILSELNRFLQLQDQARGQLKQVQIQTAEVGQISQADVDVLRTAELSQQQLERGLGDPKEGIPSLVQGLLNDLDNNQLPAVEMRGRMAEISAELDALTSRQLPDIRQQLTQASKEAQAQLAQGAPQAPVPPQMQGSLQAAADGQEEVSTRLRSLVEGLSQWDNLRRISQESSTLLSEQRQLLEQTAQSAAENAGKRPAELSPQTAADLKKLAERQADVARQLQDVLDRAADLAGNLFSSDPTSAALLEDAAQFAKEQTLAGTMREAASELSQLQPGAAMNPQTQATESMQELADILSERHERELSRLVKRLKEAEQQLQIAREAQAGLKRRRQELQQQPDSEDKRKELERLTKEEAQLAEEISRFSRRLQRLQAEDAAASLQRGSQQMRSASQQGEQGDEAAASRSEDRAEQDLEEAQQQLARRRQQAEADLTMQMVAQLQDQLSGMQKRQQALLEDTARLDTLRQQQGRLTRAQSSTLRDLATNEGSIRQETSTLAESLKEAEILQTVMNSAAEQMAAAEQLLTAKETGEAPQQAQQSAIDRFTQILEALNARPDGDGQQQEPKQEGEEQEQPGDQEQQQPQPSKQRSFAELKLLQLMQADLQTRTERLDETVSAQGELTPSQQQQYAQIAQEQGKLAELVLGLLETNSQDPAETPDLDPKELQLDLPAEEDPLFPSRDTNGAGPARRLQLVFVRHGFNAPPAGEEEPPAAQDPPSAEPNGDTEPGSSADPGTSTTTPPDRPTRQEQEQEATDAALLDELGDALFEGVPEAMPEQDGPSQADSGQTPDDEPGVTDAAAPSSDDPLDLIAHLMRQAKGRLAKNDAGPQTRQLQKRAQEELDKLIKNAQQQQQDQQQSSNSQRQQTRRQERQPGGARQQPAGSQGERNSANNQPSQEAASNAVAGAAQQANPEAVSHLIKSVWGRLPERARNELSQFSPEHFLPAYELDIEEYFKALAEENRE